MDEKIIMKDDQGNEKVVYPLVTFKHNEKNFLIYTDYTKNENNDINIYSSIYEIAGSKTYFEKIINDEEQKFVEDYIKGLEDDIKNEMKF